MVRQRREEDPSLPELAREPADAPKPDPSGTEGHSDEERGHATEREAEEWVQRARHPERERSLK